MKQVFKSKRSKIINRAELEDIISTYWPGK